MQYKILKFKKYFIWLIQIDCLYTIKDVLSLKKLQKYYLCRKIFNMKKNILLFLATVCLFASESLFAQDNMQVSGITGNLLKRIVKFGDYTTSKVKAVKSKTTLSVESIDMEWAKMNYSFTQTSPSASAEVKASADPNSVEYEQYRKMLGLSDKGKAVYSGTIAAAQTWAFCVNVVAKPSDDQCGQMIAADGTVISITGGDNTKAKDILMNKINFSYNFIFEGDVVGKVTTDDKGQVWIKDGIDSDMQLALAALSSALLTRIGMSPMD